MKKMLVTKEKIDEWTNPNYLDMSIIDKFIINNKDYIIKDLYPVFRDKIDYFINNRIGHTTKDTGFNADVFIQYSTTFDISDTFNFCSTIYSVFVNKTNITEEQAVRYKVPFFDNLFKYLFMYLTEEYRSNGINFTFIKRCNCESLSFSKTHYVIFRIAII